jgi:hypothetical protein
MNIVGLTEPKPMHVHPREEGVYLVTVMRSRGDIELPIGVALRGFADGCWWLGVSVPKDCPGPGHEDWYELVRDAESRIYSRRYKVAPDAFFVAQTTWQGLAEDPHA